MTLETYHHLGRIGLISKKVELLRGMVVAKISKSPLHELVSQKLMRLLLIQVKDGFEVRREGHLTLNDSETEPDLSVVRGRPDDWVNRHPSSADLVIEVAVSSVALDEGKGDIYAEAGIPEYWLVRPENRAVDVYREPNSCGYASKTTSTDEDILQCVRLPAVNIPVAAILPARTQE